MASSHRSLRVSSPKICRRCSHKGEHLRTIRRHRAREWPESVRFQVSENGSLVLVLALFSHLNMFTSKKRLLGATVLHANSAAAFVPARMARATVSSGIAATIAGGVSASITGQNRKNLCSTSTSRARASGRSQRESAEDSMPRTTGLCRNS